jgi:predicted DNA-binding transcriptional regulator YafY
VRGVVNRVTDAMLQNRRVTMRYDSAASRRVKEYVVEPLRITYADGGTYLTAFVPEYREMRNFAIERIRTLGVLDEKFARRPLPAEPFAHSLGAFSGTPERIEIEFNPSVAAFVISREWHRSQTFEPRQDGSVLMRLEVCVDRPLKTWVLGFGADARVIAPAHFVDTIASELEGARAAYQRERTFAMLKMQPSALEFRHFVPGLRVLSR